MKTFIVIIFSLVVYNAVLSQPSTMITFRAGYTQPLGDFYGKFGDTRATFTANPDSNTYFFRYGTAFGLSFSYAPYKSKMFYFAGGFNFSRVWQNKSYPDSTGQININYNMNILNITAGAGYRYITRSSRIIPFAELQLAFSLFTGAYSEAYADGTTAYLTLNPALRLGLEGSGGAEFKISKRVGLQLAVKYTWANIIGKNSRGDDAFHYSLNDKAETVNGYPYKNRNITYLQFFGGVTFYFGL